MKNTFKSKQKNKQMLLDPSITKIYSQLNFDRLGIDIKHSSLSIETTQNIIQAADTKSSFKLRSPDNNNIWIKRILNTVCDRN